MIPIWTKAALFRAFPIKRLILQYNYFSPLLQHRPNINLVSKAPHALRVQVPISLRDVARSDLRLGRHVLQIVPPRNVNGPINDGMRNVHALRRKLPRDRLAQSPQRPLATRERRDLRIRLDRRRGARVNQSRRELAFLGRSSLHKQRQSGLREDESALGTDFPAVAEVVDAHLKQWLAEKAPAGIEDGGRAVCSLVLFFDLCESGLDAFFVGDVGADADGFAAGVVDFFDEGFVGLWRAGEEGDWVCFGEAAGDCCACAGTDAGDDGEWGWCHC
jgi:hypothetical protein